MKRRKFLGEKIPQTIFSHWRGYPLYIIYIYLRGQLTLTLPAFMGGMVFIQIITKVVWYNLVSSVSLVVGFSTIMAYVFYHYFSPGIRAFLTTLIAGDQPDQEMATRAWIEAINFSPLVVSRTLLSGIVGYAVQFAYIFMFTDFRQTIVLQSWIATIALAVAIALIFFLFYLERMMYPISYLALAAGAQANLDHPHMRRFRLRGKLLLLILWTISVPLVMMGLFGYSQAMQLGGDPAASIQLTGTVVLFASGVTVSLALALVRSVLKPVQELEQVMGAVAAGDLTARARAITSDELADLGMRFNEMTEEVGKQERLKTAFGRYVSGSVRDGILSGDIQLGGERREITIAFTDIRNFTAWCERTTPEEVIRTLNAYFETLVQVLVEHGGTVTRYTGDGVLVLFGAPLDDPDHALHAVKAVFKANALLEAFNDIRRITGAFELHTGFGIHTGTAVVGSIGYEARAEYTPIGDPANVASRIEGLNRDLGTSILISRATYECVAPYVTIGKTAQTPVKGRVEPVQVYEVVGLNDKH